MAGGFSEARLAEDHTTASAALRENMGALYPLAMRAAPDALIYFAVSGRRSNAAISFVLRTSRMPSANAGTFQVSPSIAGTRASSRCFVGRGRDEDELALLGDDDEVAAGEQQLAVPVAPALPLEVARRGVDAREDPLVQTVDEAVVQDRARLAVLHADVAPDLADRELVAGLRQLDHDRAGAVAGRIEDALVADHDRLGRTGVVIGLPRELPEHVAPIEAQARPAARR